MWPLLVEGGNELIEAGLLLQEVLGRRFGGFLLERQMHALMAAVLLGMAGLGQSAVALMAEAEAAKDAINQTQSSP
jgi:hypothetical protein